MLVLPNRDSSANVPSSRNLSRYRPKLPRTPEQRRSIYLSVRPSVSECTVVFYQIISRQIYWHIVQTGAASAMVARWLIARFLDRMCLVLRPSGLWLRYTTLQNLIPSIPQIAPGWRVGGAKEGIKFCYLATLRPPARSTTRLITLAGHLAG